jgi:hypothetical protein
MGWLATAMGHISSSFWIFFINKICDVGILGKKSYNGQIATI